ncbi:Hpt domain-containing protein [Variovorax sp. JS1663]|uniref:Hpt domain-containing protein n=1 Tax=Variovorax sp. JS1663 TaxID=1851577 RepID=UPI000B346444|nr:Hpt domain-containing protein [Variovorax sp. JS1663]OUL99571.1 histidine kinase [Variovorax sp. JS1663]
MSYATIDRAVFAELQDTAGADFVQELLQTFFEEAPVMLTELREAHEAGNADAFRRAAHSLKSNSLTFGAQALAAMARELELGGLAAAPTADALAALQGEYDRAAAALAALSHG